jgi:trehalose 6-phosphate phosphatase
MPTLASLVPRLDWALFLDIDGTLLDLAELPSDVVVSPDLLRSLARASDALGGAVALISGRAIADIDLLFHPLSLPSAGIHGHELRHAGVPVSLGKSVPAEWRNQLALAVEGLPGVLVEDKEAAVAFHYRRAPGTGPELRARIGSTLTRLGATPATTDILEGKMVFEVRQKGINKGLAVDALMQTPPFKGRLPVFIGDDETDLDGFAAAERLGGFALPVGRGVTPGFETPEEVRQWLVALPARIRETVS